MHLYPRVSIISLLAIAASARDFPNCQSGPLASNQVCNTSLSAWQRASALVSALTLSEKIANSGDNSPGSSRLGLPSYEWWNEALHGVARSRGVSFAASGNFSYATSFPQPIVLGASFDMPLVAAVAAVTSTEARAFSNAGRAGLNYWTPNINPLRDPRWGRGQEVPSEDPLVVSEYVRRLIPGLQGGLTQEEQQGGYWKLVATCKHFAGYDIENWKGNRRYGFDAVISRTDLQDYYLAPFRACVRDAKAQSVMCSYNAVNSVPTCADPWLLQRVLRDQWDFEDEEGQGARWVTADCDALANVWTDHHYGKSAADAAAQSLNAGTDLDCGDFWPKNLQSAYSNKLINDSVLDRSLIRRYASMVKLGWFDPPAKQPYRQIVWDSVATPEAKALALRAAVEGIVLLKNDNGALPLKLGSSAKKVAVIGPLGSATTQMQGNYFGIAQKISSVASAFRDAGYTVSTSQGAAITGSSTSGFSAALSAAKEADAVVFVGGLDTSVETEEKDREQITWPGQQLPLIKQLAATTNNKPFVVVQMGTMLDSSSLMSEEGVDSLLWAGYPGQDGGKAIVSIVLGQNAPAARLPITQYPAAYVDQVRMTDMNLQPGSGNPGRTYKWYNKPAVLPFGHGLHYTTFNVSISGGASLLPATFSASALTSNISSSKYLDQGLFFSLPVSVKNTGSTTSDYVVLAFVQGQYGPSPYPNKSLAAFARLHDVKAGDATGASLDISLGSIARSDKDGNLVLWPGKYSIVLDIDERDRWDFEITGAQVVLERLASKN
ncbi:uncharacterized protein JN550_004842 [Neoarthrinium moseri]|uniref:uncharacterized protein n=1 Tax=Neoarthrinium moseri TaxID=1658444 RepID=UPI001FDD42FB|nr:uncharacterized protein JN550_004842 [Neoarthrinium moseri]KAI1870696.1 hypothetical protein JN550_004842 [Neoarthrinium moseri]